MTVFRQIRNDLRDIEAIADGYKTKIGHDLWLIDGLQKDAIQNSWDARFDKRRGKDWECGFDLLTFGDKQVLCISDKGTTGLNGTRFTTEEQLVEILNSNKRGEDLAYFLNSNWSAKSAEEGGNRGRGKTLFLASSLDKKVSFDSLRTSDNSYVFGELYLDKDKQVKFKLHYDDEARKLFRNFSNNVLSPLNKHGTRIFIVNPDRVVTDSILSGEILPFINNSRWETIKKYQAKIFIHSSKGIEYATVPYWYEDSLQNVLSKSYPLEIIKEGTQYRIKKLILRYIQSLDMPESTKGIAIQRSGMTIQRLQSSDLVHEEGIDDIYGWIEMDRKPLEEDIVKYCEGPEHFDFSWTTKPAKYLRDYIRIKIREFAKEFKITSELAKRNKAQRVAEKEAIKSLVPLFKKLGLLGKNTGKKQRKKSKRKSDEPIRLSVLDIEFPRESRRVNYGEEINGTYVVPVNNYLKKLRVLIKVYIVSDKGDSNILLEEKETDLFRGEGPKVGVESVSISRKVFKKGGYTLRAYMLSLEDTDRKLPDGIRIEKGTRLYDRVNLKFYVETDPPETGKSPFKFQPRSGENKSYLFEWEYDGDSGYIIYYNDLHPRISPLIGSGENPSEALQNYLTEQGAIIALQIKLEEDLADGSSTSLEFDKLIKSKNLDGVYPLFQKRFSEFIWDLNV